MKKGLLEELTGPKQLYECSLFIRNEYKMDSAARLSKRKTVEPMMSYRSKMISPLVEFTFAPLNFIVESCVK